MAKNHTATHILNYALRQVLGEKVDQKGSLVTEDKLRFDFSHGKPVDLKELRKIEEICNEMIQRSCVVHFRDVALDKATAITGLRALACLSLFESCWVLVATCLCCKLFEDMLARASFEVITFCNNYSF